MKDIVLYAYSPDTSFLEWFQFLLTKVEAKIHVCSDEAVLKKLCSKKYPDILLIDDHAQESTETSEAPADGASNSSTAKSKVEKILLSYSERKKRGSSMVLVLSEHYNNLEYRVDLLFHGADYFIEKPINMVELIARISAMIRHQKYVHEYIQERVYHAHSVSTFDSMERVLGYLNSHLKPTAQKFIDDSRLLNENLDNYAEKKESSKKPLASVEEEIREYIEMVHEGSMKIMASIHAIRDDVQDLMHKNTQGINQQKHLDLLFKKNLDLIKLAYHDRYNEKIQ